MMHSVRCAVLISLFGLSEAGAQTAPVTAGDPNSLGTGREVIVIDDSGKETSGRLLIFGPDQLTMVVKGHNVAVDRSRVTAIFETGDSLRNGAKIGLLAGAGLGAALVVVATALEDDEVGGMTLFVAGGAGVMGGLMGMGIGVVIDAAISGRTLIYERPGKAAGTGIDATRTVSIAPVIAASGAKLVMLVRW